MPFVWMDNQFVAEELAQISIKDTGLLHAAGVFTTMRAARGRVLHATDHLQRLRRSCEQLGVHLSYGDEILLGAMTELLSRNELSDARLRLTVTRGSARHDPVHGLHLSPSVFLTAGAFEPYPQAWYEHGMTVVLMDDQKLNPYDIQAGHKTLNYFSRLTGLSAATRQAAGEAMWFNVHNYLQSASVANVFIVKDQTLITPPTQDELSDPSLKAATPYPRSNVLPGVTRRRVIDLASEMTLAVRFSAIDIEQLLGADEVFLTNSVMGVMPVCRIEKKVVGNDRPGEIWARLAKAYTDEVENPA